LLWRFAASPAGAKHASPADPAAARQRPARRRPPGDIVVTGSRIRRDPLSQDAPIVFVDQDGHRQDRPQLGQRRAAAPAELGRRPQRQVQQFGQPRQSADGGGVGAGSAEIDLRYLGSRRVLVLVDGLRFVNGASAAACPARSTSTPSPKA
jgi:iron complex outermembrane receptor protein